MFNAFLNTYAQQATLSHTHFEVPIHQLDAQQLTQLLINWCNFSMMTNNELTYGVWNQHIMTYLSWYAYDYHLVSLAPSY